MSEKELFDKDLADEDWLSVPAPLSVDIDQKESQSKDRKNRSISYAKIAIFLLIIGAGIAYFYLGYRHRSFPEIQAGIYSGEINNLSEIKTPIYLEYEESQKKILFWMLQEECQPVLIEMSTNKKPLLVKNSCGDFLLSGYETLPKEYEGRIYDTTKGRSGTWKIRPLKGYKTELSKEDQSSTHLLLLTKRELDEVETKLAAAELKLPQQKKEIQRLINFIEQKEGLKSNADKKFNDEKIKAEKLRKELSEKQNTLERFEKKVELAYRVTDMGKLVSLARESLAKDRAWIQAMLGSSSQEEESPELQAGYDKARRIVKLKSQISEEQEHIYSLLHPGGIAGMD